MSTTANTTPEDRVLAEQLADQFIAMCVEEAEAILAAALQPSAKGE